MSFLNIAGYQFAPMTHLDSYRFGLQSEGERCQLKGTILLSKEGINLSLAGEESNVLSFVEVLKQNESLKAMRFHQTYSEKIPFKHLKVKIKPEIITMKAEGGDPSPGFRAPHISPQELKKWLDDNRGVTLLDTRNDYEVRFGTFKNALNLNMQKFSELPHVVEPLDREKPVVMFCTGGIRCEKAGLYMQSAGFKEVYQLDGGILGYFKEVGGAHYDGDCFIFDERISLNPALQETHTTQCPRCYGPIPHHQQCQHCASNQ